MQSPIDTALVMQPDFGPVELVDTSIMSNRDEQIRQTIEVDLLLKNKELKNKVNTFSKKKKN